MSDAERMSPRVAIRNWLQGTDSKLTAKPADAFSEQQNNERGSRRHSRRHHETKYPLEIKDQHDKEAGRKHQIHKKSETRQKIVTDKVLPVNSHRTQPRALSKENAALNSNGLGLAERLGLHAPFRTFKDYSDSDIFDVQCRPRKRRRSRSSTSSYLEPAAAADLSDNGHEHPSHATIVRTASTGTALGDRVKNTSPTASQGSEEMLPSPEKLLKSYERRPRHKTRQDRYELKDNNRDSTKMKQAAKKDRGERKQKKHKRKEKSGAALMHDFAAQNVAHDRLTLKPAKTLGLFGKGRASSPVRRRGLPDLAFSEMTFLKSRREKPKDSFEDSFNRPSDKKKRRKSTKAADTEAEISRYFMSAKPTCLDVTTSHSQRYQQDRRRSRDQEPPHAFVDLPDRPFLGFGSCGPNASISPAKIPLNTDSRSLRRGDSRSPACSTSYLTWSDSGESSYITPPRKTRHHVEPLTSSKLSNRKKPSPAPHKGRQSIPPVSSPRVPKTSSRSRSTTCRPSSKYENANEAPGQNSESRLAISEGLSLGEKIQYHGNTGINELDAAKIPQNIEGLVLDNTQAAETATHDGPKLALPPQNQAACQPSRHEPQYEPRAPDVHPVSAQMQLISPHKDPLDAILEALLRDCNTNVGGSDRASRAQSSHGNFHFNEKAIITNRIKGHSHMPARAFVHATETPTSDSISHKKPHSASFKLTSAHEGSISTHTLSRGSLNSFNRSSLGYTRGYPPIPTQRQVDSTNAWNGYDSLYERQQEQADLPPGSREQLSSHTAMPDDLSGPSRGTNHAAAPDGYAQDLYPVEIGDEFDDYKPYVYQTLEEGDENSKYQEIRHCEQDDQFIDHGASYGSGKSLSDESHEDCSSGIMLENDVNGYQQREGNAHQQSFAQGSDQHETEHQLFTTSIPDTCPSWRPRQIFSRNYGPERSAVDAQVHDVDPALSGFWTPHKLY